jgi:GNAT superfamily N-acetyltransferase
MNIRQAQIEDIPDLIPLFDGYRMFYRQKSDFMGAKQFLTERLSMKESIIYMAYIDENAVGFVQLFPIFSSVSMERMMLLNDLYIDQNYRGQGIGTALIDAAKALCKKNKSKGLALQTETDNPAQKLYEAVGFVRDPDLHYFWTNTER